MKSKRICILLFALASLTVGGAYGLIQWGTTWVLADQPSESDQPSNGYMVQQPTERTSYKPDFSSRSFANSNERDHLEMLRAFRDVIGKQNMATVRVLVGGQHRVMGAIVHRDGLVITKASELSGQAIECRLHDDVRVPAKILVTSSELDLALLRLDFGKRKPTFETVRWSQSEVASVGTWLATTDSQSSLPLAVGVVGVLPRSIRQEQSVLGVNFEWSGKGNRVTFVLPRSGADQCGLRKDDIIVSINGKEFSSRQAMQEKIRSLKAGQEIEMLIHRNDEPLQLRANLMDLNSTLLDPTEMEVNGRVSARSTGFKRVIQHDTFLQPQHCGGIVVNVQGEAVGLNIARAGRVSCYALPANVVQTAVGEMIETAKNNSSPTQSNVELIIRAQDNPVPSAQ